MNLKDIKEKLFSLLTKNRIPEACELMYTFLPETSDVYGKFFILDVQFKRTEEDFSLGLIDIHDRNKEFSRIIKAIIDLYLDLQKKGFEESSWKSSRILGEISYTHFGEERTLIFGNTAKRLSSKGEYKVLRQWGAFSSFSIPDAHWSHKIWEERDGEQKRSNYYHYLQARERIELEEHLKHTKAKLILDPQAFLNDRGTMATLSRLKSLQEFLQSPYAKTTEIVSASGRGNNPHYHLSILGDSVGFAAESSEAGIFGYRTNFFWTQEEIERKIQKFEKEFTLILETKYLGDRLKAKDEVIQEIKQRISDLEN